MENAKLFPSKKTKGYFGTRRFDRKGEGEAGKVHMVLASGLLAVAKKIGLSTSRSRKIASEVRDCVFEMLGKYI